MPIDFPDNPTNGTQYTNPSNSNVYIFSNGSWSLQSILSSARGGTGFNTYNRGDILFGNASGTLSKLGAGSAGSVLSTQGSGADPTWIAMSVSGGAGTVATPGNQYQLAGYYSGSGASVSGSSSFTNNTASGIVSITHATGSTSPSFGALLVSGGVGIAGTLSYFKSQIGVAGTSSLPSMAFIGNTNNPVYLNVLENNALSFEGYHGQLLSISPDLTSGYVFTVGDISGIPLFRANANANITSNEYGGNFGIGTTNPGYKLEVNGQTAITGSTASISTSTGALIVTGGVGVGGSLNVGALSKFSNVLEVRSGNEFRLYRTADTNYTVLKSSDVTGNITFTLPLNTGTNGQFLTTDGSGVLSFTTDPIQVNSGNQYEIGFYSSAGSSVYGSSTFKNDINTGKVTITHTTGSGSTTSGALVVNGGVGVGGSLYVGTGNVSTGFSTGDLVVFGGVGISGALRIGDTTASSSITTGALTVRGGVGIGGTLYVGSGIASTNTTTGDLIVTGGVGIGGSLRVGNTTNSGSSITGAFTVAGGVGIAGNIYGGGLLNLSSGLTANGAVAFNSNGNAVSIVSRIVKTGSTTFPFTTDAGSGASGVCLQVRRSNVRDTVSSGSYSFVNVNAFQKISFSTTTAGQTYTNAATVYIEDAPDSSITGALGTSPQTVTITNPYALYVENGRSYFGGAINSGGNTFSKSLGNGDIALDNGTADSPAILMYWGNNKNIGIDTFYSGAGTTRLRIVKELNETGGGELWSVDRNGIVTQSAWAAGEVIKMTVLVGADLTGSHPITINSTSDTDVASYSYTPVSSNSYLVIEFITRYTIAGAAEDNFISRIAVDGAEQTYGQQYWINGAGGGTRSGVLFPLMARYTNSNTTAKTISVTVRRGASDDNATVDKNATTVMKITEIGR
jgi:hypothetical protein